MYLFHIYEIVSELLLCAIHWEYNYTQESKSGHTKQNRQVTCLSAELLHSIDSVPKDPFYHSLTPNLTPCLIAKPLPPTLEEFHCPGADHTYQKNR